MKHVLLQLTRDWLRWTMKIRSKHACIIWPGTMFLDTKASLERSYAVVPWHWMQSNTTYHLYLPLGKNHPEMMYRYITSRSKPYYCYIESTPSRDPAMYPDKSKLYHCTI